MEAILLLLLEDLRPELAELKAQLDEVRVSL